MPPLLVLLLAAADPVAVEPITYRLPLRDEAPRVVGCPRGASAEIVVCGRRGRSDRLEPVAPPPGAGPREGGVIGADLPFGRIEPSLQSVARPDGTTDKRAMVKLRIGF